MLLLRLLVCGKHITSLLSFAFNRNFRHVLAGRDRWTQGLHLQPRQLIPSHKGKNQLSPVECPWEFQPNSRQAPYPWVVGHQKGNSLLYFIELLFYFACSFFFFALLVICLFVLSFVLCDVCFLIFSFCDTDLDWRMSIIYVMEKLKSTPSQTKVKAVYEGKKLSIWTWKSR